MNSKNRRQKSPTGHVNGHSGEHIDSHDDQQNAELKPKGDQVGENDRYRNDEPVKIDLPEQGGISDERLRRGLQRTREVGPGDVTDHVEQERRCAVGRQAGDPAKNDRKNDGGEKRTDDMPRRPQDRLLVYGDEIAPHKQADEISISPQLSETPIEPAALRQNDGDYCGIAGGELIW